MSDHKTLLYIVNVDWFFASHRLPIAVAAREAGWDVHVASQMTDQEERFRDLGLTVHPFSLKRGSMSPLNAFWFMYSIWRICRRVRPDVVHTITIYPVLLGGLAVQAAGVPAIVSAVSGLGHIFTTRSLGAALKRFFVSILYRLVLRRPGDVVIFQNEDDRQLISGTAIYRGARALLIPGVGVDLNAFAPAQREKSPVRVLFAARLLYDKGISEFVQAARLLASPDIQFIAVGNRDVGNPASIPIDVLASWRAEDVIDWRGHVTNIAALMAEVDIVVLPSYREGFPKVLMEAAAAGRAVVTTDVPGCRDAIRPGETGILVPVRDAKALSDAIRKLVQNKALRICMGKAGRRDAEARYNVHTIAAAHLAIYNDIQ